MSQPTYHPIQLRVSGGSLEGYVVDAREPNIGNYLSQHTHAAGLIQAELIDRQERVALLRSLWVDEDRRGEGIGTSLVSDFLSAAEAAGATAFLLVCDAYEDQRPNFDLRVWYEQFGFAATVCTSSGPLMAIPESLSDVLLTTCGGNPQNAGAQAPDTAIGLR